MFSDFHILASSNGLCSAKLGDFFEKIEKKMDNIVFFMYFCKKFD